MRTADRLSQLTYGCTALLLAGILAGKREGLSPDSCWYLDVAEHFARGQGLVTDIIFYDNQYDAGAVPVPYTIQSPLFPLLVGCLVRIGIPAIAAAGAINVVCFALSVMAVFELGVVVRGRLVAYLAACGFAIMACILFVVSMVWTETLFMLISILAVLTACRAVTADRFRAGLYFVCGTLAGISLWVRTTAVLLLISLGMSLFAMWLIKQRTRAGFWCLVCWLLPAGIASLLFMGRNWWILRRLDGVVLPPPERSVHSAMIYTANLVAADFLPVLRVARVIGVEPTGIALVTVGVIGGILTLVWFRWNLGQAFAIVMTYCWVYLVGIPVMSARVAFSLDSRTLCCIYPFLIVAVSAIIVAAAGTRRRWLFTPIAVGIVAVFFCQQCRHTCEQLTETVAEAHPVSRGTAPLREWIVSHTAPGEPLLATNGWWVHRFAGNRPTLCATFTRWNAKVWDEAAVLELSRRYGSSTLVIFFPADQPEYLDRFGPYLSELFHNPESSRRLTLTLRGDNYACYRILPERTASVDVQ